MAGGDLFGHQDAKSTLSRILDNIKKEITENGTEYILQADHNEWVKYFIDKYTLIPLEILEEEITVQFKGKRSKVFKGETLPSNYIFDVRVPFLGHEFLFHLRPSNFEQPTKYAMVESININGELLHTISLPTEDKERFLRDKESFIDFVRRNIPKINQDVSWFNEQIEPTFREEINRIIVAKEKSQNFLKEIGIPINKETVEVFQVPKFKKPEIIKPIIVKDDSKKGYSQIPTVSLEFYNDITVIINKVYKSVEKKPSIYLTKDEEDLRDYLLPVLETRYDLITATGETFNKEGKTDILLRYIDGTNIFIAECKKWYGSKMAKESISQLFDRYITWRDTKVAIITFVNIKDFSSVLSKLHETVKEHEYFLEFTSRIDETTYEYKMMVPGDKSKIVTMRTLTFCMPSKYIKQL